MRDSWFIGIITVLLGCTMGSGCGYRHYAGLLKPVEETRQMNGTRVYDDGSIVYTQNRLEISLRPVTDEELNRQFASYSTEGPKSTNPYTYGNSQYWDVKTTPQRFTVFLLKVKNYGYPKIWLDPEKIVMIGDNGREYGALSFQQLEVYYRAYALGYRGNEYRRLEERRDTLRRTMYRAEYTFSGQEAEGYVVFLPLHPDIKDVTVMIRDVALRFDFRNEPVEKTEVLFIFHRNIGRIYANGRIEMK